MMRSRRHSIAGDMPYAQPLSAAIDTRGLPPLDTPVVPPAIDMQKLQQSIAVALDAENKLKESRKRSWSIGKKHKKQLSSSSVNETGANPFALPGASYVTSPDADGSPRVVDLSPSGTPRDSAYFSDDGGTSTRASPKKLKKIEKDHKRDLAMRSMLEDKLGTLKEQNKATQKRLDSMHQALEALGKNMDTLYTVTTKLLERISNTTDNVEDMLKRQRKRQAKTSSSSPGDYAALYVPGNAYGNVADDDGDDIDDGPKRTCCVIT